MSVHVSAWAWKQTVGDAGAKLLLLKLADQANDSGECFPSHRSLAMECEMSRRTVQRKLELLYELGLVVAEPRMRATGGKTSLLYVLGPMRQIGASRCVTGDAGDASLLTQQEPSLEPIDPSDALTSHGTSEEHQVRDLIGRSLGAVA